ncbi:MAG: histidine kinase dimerization/phospho-acceptor domain-containing protein, partial [Akkermansia sp.]
LKVKGWWKNSLIYLALHWLGETLHHPLRQLREILLNLPLVWKTLLLGMALAVAEVYALFQVYWYGSVTPILLFNVLVAFIVLSAAVCMKKLQQGCQAIADGDGDFRVDTSRMYLDFRRHGEDLNRIGDGISVAVEERLKSERFKTELITNVSHDLKTPLTSIVNYVDLLSKLELPEEARGYVEVLRRQSRAGTMHSVAALLCEQGGSLPQEGDRLIDAVGATVGRITSACCDPEDGQGRALAYLLRRLAYPGTRLRLVAGERRIPVIVTDTPVC